MTFLVRSALVLAMLSTWGTATVAPAQADPDARPGTVAERPRDAAVHAVDGEVRSIAQVGASVVFGGTFTRVGPVTRGAAGVVSTATGTFGSAFPDVVGAVTSVVSDGADGWYLGGSFSSVGGQPRENLAQVDATGAVTAFDPAPNGDVFDLARTASGELVLGGSFTEIAGDPAIGAARLTSSGALVWGATVTGGPVRAVAVSADESLVYVGGEFSQVSGVQTRRFAGLDAETGARSTTFTSETPNQPVLDIAVRPQSVVIAGNFTSVGGVGRVRLAELDASTGALGPLSVAVNNSVIDIEIDEASGTLYLAGAFGQAGGQARNRLAAVTLSGAGTVLPLSVPSLSGTVSSLALDGAGGLYVGGAFQVTPAKDNPAQLARVNLATNAVTAVVPYYETPRSLARTPATGTSGVLTLIWQAGSLFVGGDFSDYGTTARSGLAAYDLATGALRPDFDPAPDGEINSVKASANGQAVFVGGEFASIGGVPRDRIAKLDIDTGLNVPGFTAAANSYVKDMAVRTDGQTVYVGGNFDQFNGVPTSRLVAIDATTGAIVPSFSMPLTNPTNEASEGGLRAMALSPDETRLMVIGNFRTIAGVDRPLIAQIDVSGGEAVVTSWRTELYDQPCARSGKIGFMRDVDISPDGTKLYSVSAGHFYYPACDSVNAWSMTPAGDNLQPLWTKKIGDTLESVAADQDAVYISGHFRYLETETRTQSRFQIAALDPETGEGLNWDPNAGGFRGVLTVELEPAGLFAGSDGDAFGLVNHGRNAFWPNPAPGVEVRAEPTRPWVLAPAGTVASKIRVQNTFTDRPLTITALTDQRLGNLDGSGSCALPQTLAAGELYSCNTASESVAGTAPSTATSVVTVTADDAGSTVSDTDTRSVEVIASAPVFRLRAVAGPGAVAFPGATVRFSLTTMNLDVERPVTVTSITNPTYGDVSAECGLPQVVQPNRLIYCHVDRVVTGSVGARPSFSFTAAGTYDTGTLTSTSAQTVTINPPVGGAKVLAVVANPAALTTSDSQISSRVDNNFAISYADDNTVQVADVPDDVSAVLIYPSAVEARLSSRLRQLDRPTMVFHSRMLDEMGMTAGAANGTISATEWDIDKAMHPLPATRSGTVVMNKAAISTAWGNPAAGATSVASVPGGGSTEFVYDEGDQMTTGPAPSCRVFFGASNTTKFNSTAWALLTRAVSYVTMDCGKNMLWTAAGNGTTSYPGDGNQSVAVGINTPWGVAIDAQRRVYYADAAAHVVRRIGTGGVVTTIAGTGTAGSTGDGGQAAAARLNAPVRVAFDQDGNLHIADSGNNKIRKVDLSTGVISTVVGTGQSGNQGDGGQATAARLRTPYDVAFGPDGSMYIADRANHKIRKVDVATGTITTFAGSGQAGYNGDEISAVTARLNSPYGVDVDNDGNVYIADYDNERVRVVDTNGVIHTFAGTGVATIDGDGGPANAAGLHKPQYVLVTPAGDLYIGESNNNRVRVVRNGQIDTIAGSGQFGYVGDGGAALFSTWSRPSSMALDPSGNLWVVDRGNRRIRVINAS